MVLACLSSILPNLIAIRESMGSTSSPHRVFGWILVVLNCRLVRMGKFVTQSLPNLERKFGLQYTQSEKNESALSAFVGLVKSKKNITMKKAKGSIISNDGKERISLEEFDRLADSGSDKLDCFLDWNKARRGGVRPGAGRKAKPGSRLEVKIRPDLREKLRQKAKEKGMTQVELVESVIEKL